MLHSFILSIIVLFLNFIIVKSRINVQLFIKILLSILLPIIFMYGFKTISENNYSNNFKMTYFIIVLSLSLICLQYIFEFINFVMSLNPLSNKGENLEIKEYIIKLKNFIVMFVFPIFVTIFQFILIWMPEKINI